MGGCIRRVRHVHVYREIAMGGVSAVFIVFTCTEKKEVTAEAATPSHFLLLQSSSRSVIDFRLMASVETLCRRADVDGGRTPITPRIISPRLKDMMNL